MPPLKHIMCVMGGLLLLLMAHASPFPSQSYTGSIPGYTFRSPNAIGTLFPVRSLHSAASSGGGLTYHYTPRRSAMDVFPGGVGDVVDPDDPGNPFTDPFGGGSLDDNPPVDPNDPGAITNRDTPVGALPTAFMLLLIGMYVFKRQKRAANRV